MLENAGLAKTAHNHKHLMHVLRTAGVELRGVVFRRQRVFHQIVGGQETQLISDQEEGVEAEGRFVGQRR